MIKKFAYVLIGWLWSIIVVHAASLTPLPVDKAFQFSVQSVSSKQIVLHWQIAPGYHLYRERISIQEVSHPGKLGKWILPPGIPMQDNILGKYQIYRQQLIVPVMLLDADQRSSLDLFVGYQGCSEANFCYPPVTKKIHLLLNNSGQKTAEIQDHIYFSHNMNMQTRIEKMLTQKNYAWIMLVFVGLGLLLAFTPCVLPMVPILSSIIVGQDRHLLTARQAFFLSVCYVMGMALAYALAGMLVAFAGSHFTAALQAPWVIALFSLLFILLALSLFGLYELRLPHFLHHRVVHLSNRQKSGSFIGAFIMGALAVLIVSPCVTAPLVGVLTFIAQTGNMFLGGTALFFLGIGMGLPLLVIGTTEGKFLPKSGPWMQVIKSSFGVLLIALALYLLQRIIPASISLLLWGAFFIMLSAYLGVGTHLRLLSSGWLKFSKGLGLLTFCYGVILLVGGALGHEDPLQPLKGTFFSAVTDATKTSKALNFIPVTNLSQVQEILQTARAQHKKVMLDFYADWCVACHQMDRTTFTNPQVQALLQSMILVRADVTANTTETRNLQDYFHVVAPPTILFFDEQGNELVSQRIVGEMGATEFLRQIVNSSLK